MVSENSRTNIVRNPGDHKVTFTVMIACAVQAGINVCPLNYHERHIFFHHLKP